MPHGDAASNRESRRLVPLWQALVAFSFVGACGYFILIPCMTISLSTSDTGLFPYIRKTVPEPWILGFVTAVAPGLVYGGYKLWIHPNWKTKSNTQVVAGRLMALIFCLSWIVPFGFFVYAAAYFLVG